MIAERLGKDDRKFELVEEAGAFLRDLNTYFPKLMNYLWEKPKIVTTIIKNTEIQDLREYLAPFFANNFYENILSSYYIEDNLMYVLTMLLEDEINNLTNINQDENFLNNTPCGCLLEELKRKNDIQEFFKTIILNAVEDLEVNYSSYRFNFNISSLTEDYKRQSVKEPKNKRKNKIDEAYLKYPTDSQRSDSISLEDSNNIFRNKKKMKMEQENFNQKYIPSLDKDSLLKIIEDFKNNKKMYDYCYSKLSDCTPNKDIFSNKKFLENLYKCEYSDQLLLNYQNFFTIVISFIDSILDRIINNFHLLPYSVKCLCKIISMLITKKFPLINETEKNAFIAKFFFGKLLVPILANPAIEAFISNFIISENTKKNLCIICKIINKFSSGHFYKSNTETCDYTPYNWYFIEKMGSLFNIFDHITKVILPGFIEKFINKELPPDYEYDYFKEHPDEDINYRSICYNLDQGKVLLNIMSKCQSKIFTSKKTIGLQKTMEKLNSEINQQLLQSILNSEKNDKRIASISHKSKKKDKDDKEKDKEQETPKLHFFLVKTLLTNDRYKDLFDIEAEETDNFSIKELKVIPNKDEEETIKKNNIIKVKNFFCSLLYNYNKLVKTDFDEGTTKNTETILNELNIFMKSSNFVVDGSIPSEWYVKSLLEYLQKIPEDLSKNDCENLYNEIEKDVINSIKKLDIEALSVIMGKLKFAKRGLTYYEECKKLLRDIKLNEETKDIIDNEFIPVEIKFIFDPDNELENFEINPCNFKEKDRNNQDKIKDYEKSKKCKLCITINDFTKKFPNLVKYQELQDADIFEIQKNLEFPNKINLYRNLIKTHLEKKGITDITSINLKIYDYVMSKIYDKIYPVEPYEEDNKIFQQSVRLSWTGPKHFIKAKRKFVFGSFLTKVKGYFKLIDSEKSPRKKILNMIEIFNTIGFLLRFNGVGSEAGVDDQLPILNYAFVKAQPLRMYSNVKFMELYIGDRKNKSEGSQLTQLLGICDLIAKIKSTDLIDVNNEEFIRNCNESTKEDIGMVI